MEEFRNIKGFNDYQVSNLGRVKSLKRNKERILKANNSKGYMTLRLTNDNKVTGRTLHSLVAEAFLNHNPDGHKIVVHHIDNDKKNNNIENLQLVSQRENSFTHHKGTSKYKGVYWNKEKGKWKAQIMINKKVKHLGYFTDELEAAKTYKNKLKTT